MPSLFTVGGYRFFFWSNEEGEPIHVHLSKGAPSPNATKLWLTKSGGCVVAHNKGQIPEKDLRELVRIAAAQHDLICESWKKYFDVEDVSFIC